MVANKHSAKIILAVMAAAVLLCFLAISFSGKLTELLGGTGVRMEYESKLFDTDEIIRVDIQMDEDTWSQMLSNATSEEYYVCDVVINGVKIQNVAIRPKGNTSLSAIAMDPDIDRYSLKLEFDHFVEGQTCYGLDKLILNNNYADATNMKEAIVYDMYRYIGAEASLYNYAEVSVNGEYWGVYLALEGVEESFMLRHFGTQDGALYKPDSMEMGGGASDGAAMPDMGKMDLSGLDVSDREGMTPPSGAGGFSRGGGGADLNYTDDDLNSYSTIWDGEITKTDKADHCRVVTALRNISEGTDLETYLDVDNVLKYMAVHTFAVNMDSLSGSMAHNYYLYEYDGQLNIFPWDYNLSFGGMSMGNSGDATDMVNDAIDTPFSGTDFFDALLSNEEYLARYHAYLQQLVDEYVNGGRFDAVYQRIRSQIDSLVETDPTAFYSYEEYENAAQLLYETVKLRAQSIAGQLDGSIPSTDAEQRQDSSALIDASHIDIGAMGQFDMGGNTGNRFGGAANDSDREDADNGGESSSPGNGSAGRSDTGQSPGGNAPSDLPEDFDPNRMPNGGGFTPGNRPDTGTANSDSLPDPGGFQPGNMPNMGNFNAPGAQDAAPKTQSPEDVPEREGSSDDEASSESRDRRPSFSGMPGQSANPTRLKTLLSYGVYLVIALAALVIVWLYKRRK